MAIPARQIGWSTKANLLWEISKQLEILTQVAGNVYIPPCPVSDWTFVPGNNLPFPTNQDGYTLYTGAWTYYDDGQTVDTFPLGGDFYTNGTSDNTSYLSTNGYMLPANSLFQIYGNGQDLYLTPGDPLSDGDTQNFWYQSITESTRWKTSMLIYCGHCCGTPSPQDTPYSYILNIYRDSQYQYIETTCKYNEYAGGNAGPDGNTYESTNASQVWQSNLNGDSWTYLGFGTVE